MRELITIPKMGRYYEKDTGHYGDIGGSIIVIFAKWLRLCYQVYMICWQVPAFPHFLDIGSFL